MNPFSLAIPIGLLGPALAVAVFTYAWRSALPHIWWFIGIAGLTSYFLMVMCVTWALANVGISNNSSGTPTPMLDPIAIRYLSFMLVWLAGSAIVFFFTRFILSKI